MSDDFSEKMSRENKRYRGLIVCNNCGATCYADGTVRDGLDQLWIGGQHVCDRFDYGFFVRDRQTGRARSEETDG